MQRIVLTAAQIAPMDQPIIRDGAIVIENDRIAAVGAAKSLASSRPDAQEVDLGNVIVLPGLINAHTHLELSDAKLCDRPGAFTDWILSLPREPDRDIARIAAAGIEQPTP